MLLAALEEPEDREALRFPGRALSFPELAAWAGAAAEALAGARRVAVWAEPVAETCVAVAGALRAGVAVVPLNPKLGERELGHVLADSAPELVLHAPATALPAAVGAAARTCAVDLDRDPPAGPAPPAREPAPEEPALVIYTSGTTGPPKGAVLPFRALAANLDALAEAWAWTAADALIHGLPLFHVHGLVLGVLGPLRVGSRLEHLGRFTPEAAADALRRGGTMLFGVPTMYHRLAEAAEADPAVADALRGARLLVSGSAALPAVDHARIERATGQRIAERYGLSETLIDTAVRADGERRPGFVGPPLPGVEIRLRDEDGGIAELEVRGPNVFTGYLGRPDATAAVLDRDGWFRTGDLVQLADDGYVRVVGRKATDLIKTGGYKVGAGEVEGALLEHPAVAEAAVAGRPDPDLGERIVAFVVLAPGAAQPAPEELAHHVAALLSPHKRPREVRFLDELPRNEMGKVRKRALPD